MSYKITGYNGQDIHYTLEINPIDAEGTKGSHIFLEALVDMIQEADTDGWEKKAGEVTQEEYHLAILRALANHIEVDTPPGVTVKEMLIDLVDQLFEEKEED